MGCRFDAMIFPPSWCIFLFKNNHLTVPCHPGPFTQQLFDRGNAAEVVIQCFPQSPAVALPSFVPATSMEYSAKRRAYSNAI